MSRSLELYGVRAGGVTGAGQGLLFGGGAPTQAGLRPVAKQGNHQRPDTATCGVATSGSKISVPSWMGTCGALVLVLRECDRSAIILALVIPLFTWYFAYQRWDVAKWPFLINVAGLLVDLFGVFGGA